MAALCRLHLRDERGIVEKQRSILLLHQAVEEGVDYRIDARFQKPSQPAQSRPDVVVEGQKGHPVGQFRGHCRLPEADRQAVSQ